jgi:hypothetical protein
MWPQGSCSVLPKFVAIERLLDKVIDWWMRIKTATYSDFQAKPGLFYWHGLLQITIGPQVLEKKERAWRAAK